MRQFRGIIESPYTPSIDVLWVHDNELKYFSEGKWKSLSNREVKESIEPKNNKKYLEYINLYEGTNKDIKTTNYDELVNSTSKFICINDGFGVYTWDINNGGQAHVVTAYGDTVYYSIYEDGAVVKSIESPDIYLSYINAGGTKTKEQFINELVDLIG